MARQRFHQVTQAIQAARHVVGQTGYVAGTIAYLQTVNSEELRSRGAGDGLLGDAIQTHRQLYAHNLAAQIVSLLDPRRDVLSARRLSQILHSGGQTIDVIWDRVNGLNAERGKPIDREQFDNVAAFIRNRVAALADSESLVQIQTFRHNRVAHLALADSQVSFADMAEVSSDLMVMTHAIQSVFADDVNQRDPIDLYEHHLNAAAKLFGLSQPVERRFTRTEIEFQAAL